jgi:hypothetical protein
MAKILARIAKKPAARVIMSREFNVIDQGLLNQVLGLEESVNNVCVQRQKRGSEISMDSKKSLERTDG